VPFDPFAVKNMLKRLGQKFSRSLFVAWLGAMLVRSLCATLHWELVKSPSVPLAPLLERDSLLFAFWHNRLFVSTEFYRKYFPQGRGIALVSRSRDGDFFSRLIHALGFGTARGSSSKGGSAALRELLRLLKNEKADIGITPDGPRGPKYEVQSGIIQLAQMSGKGILVWSIEYDRKWELKSWDRFQIPQPFARARVRIEDPIHVPSRMSEEEFENFRRQVETLLGNS
jgi:lysophospholipid acyltransferase (LPLAT)-like uncharacterized protein